MSGIFRPLRADEIECRVGTANEKGITILLYKDARCDMTILDETVGALNWKRSHSRENANCIVSIYDKGKDEWVGKEDTGTESFTEKEKGLASDSFKRACVNWGIGRELYSAPRIFIPASMLKTLKKNDRGAWAMYDYLKVAKIEYKNDEIFALDIVNNSTGGNICFSFAKAYTCADCGKEIKDAYIAQGTEKAYGRTLCKECGLKAKRAKAEEERKQAEKDRAETEKQFAAVLNNESK